VPASSAHVERMFSLILKVVGQAHNLPVYKSSMDKLYPGDWLIGGHPAKANIYISPSGRDIILNNSLVNRAFRLLPNVACTEFKNMVTGQQLLRAVMPEAAITINGKEYNVGGLYGQKEKAYLQNYITRQKKWMNRSNGLLIHFHIPILKQ